MLVLIRAEGIYCIASCLYHTAHNVKALNNFLQKERLDFLAKEEKLSRNVKTLKSKLNKEQSKLASLEEKMQMVSRP